MPFLLVLLVLGCSTAELKPPPINEPSIPANYSTYTREDFFSISYPSNWAPAMASMDELWAETIHEVEGQVGVDIELGDLTMVFNGGLPTLEGYYPFVNVLATSAARGSASVEDIVDSASQFDRENSPGYQELARIATTVGGREAIIIDCVDTVLGDGPWRYLQMVTISGKYTWWVTCGSERTDYQGFERTFDSIVRSFRSHS